MKRFINFKSYELISAQNDIENIYNLKNKIYNRFEWRINKDIKSYKELFEDIAQDFRDLGI